METSIKNLLNSKTGINLLITNQALVFQLSSADVVTICMLL